jgi:excinuclease UvrABC nuclease subunit
MPFDHPFPRSFTASSIRDNAPAVSGVYGISNAGRWIYIGEADNIQSALIRHLQEPDTKLLKERPTGFVYEACELTKRSDRQNRLVLEYEPYCNRHWSGQK